jgi:chemotaxis signal transduction protein
MLAYGDELANSPMASLPKLVLICQVADRLLAISAATVDRIVQMVAITPLRNGPQHVRGIIDLRGTIRPVVDVRVVLGLPTALPDVDQHLVLLSAPTQCALWIDHAEDVRSVSESDFEVDSSSSALFVRCAGALIPFLASDALEPGPVLSPTVDNLA